MKELKKRTCKGCRVTFMPKYHWQIYCTCRCRRDTYKLRRRRGEAR